MFHIFLDMLYIIRLWELLKKRKKNWEKIFNALSPEKSGIIQKAFHLSLSLSRVYIWKKVAEKKFNPYFFIFLTKEGKLTNFVIQENKDSLGEFFHFLFVFFSLSSFLYLSLSFTLFYSFFSLFFSLFYCIWGMKRLKSCESAL